MMTASPNDVCLTAHWANIASLRPTGATSYLQSKYIISPQAMHHLTGKKFYDIIVEKKVY